MTIDLDIQWAWLDESVVYMCAAANGYLDVQDFRELLARVGESFAVFDGHAVIDLRRAHWDFDNGSIYTIVAEFVTAGLRMNNKIALVCRRDIDHYGQLVVIASAAANRGFTTRAFYDFAAAIKWLAEKWSNC
jgi:hypothetical protein